MLKRLLAFIPLIFLAIFFFYPLATITVRGLTQIALHHFSAQLL